MMSEKIIEMINEWNPIDIYPLLEEEYEDEVNQIKEACGHSQTSEQLGEMIHHIFTQSFGQEFTKSREECNRMARKIKT
ncbi:DUF1871 family protein [Marinicrinis sediminis]|uniref:DUF1871 family protein n=1 Tax=Marinicrinis sediminis TaxID=1652465 RepID=A0ABW5R747_9BACL